MVTGYGLALRDGDHDVAGVTRIESRLSAAGLATALMVTLEMVADCASPDELLVSPTTQFVAA